MIVCKQSIAVAVVILTQTLHTFSPLILHYYLKVCMMYIKGILPMYETCRGFCGIAVGDSILLTSSSEMHYCHIAPVETYTFNYDIFL